MKIIIVSIYIFCLSLWFFSPELLFEFEKNIAINIAPFFDSGESFIVAGFKLLFLTVVSMAKYILYPIATSYAGYELYKVLVNSNKSFIKKFISQLASFILILAGYYIFFKYEIYESVKSSVFITFIVCILIVGIEEQNRKTE